MKKILVTGGAGFIGSHVVDLLVDKGCEVTVFDNLSTGHKSNVNVKARFFWGDIRNKEELADALAGQDVCIHLAAVASVAKSIDKWSDSSSVNALGTANVFEISQKMGLERVIYASSAAVYGTPQSLPIAESSPIAPLSPYGADKYLSELYGHSASVCFDLNNIGLRFFNVYGPRQDPSSPYSGVISAFIDRAKTGKNITIFGDGLQTRDFIYVGDVAQLISRLIESSLVGAEVFNVCTNKVLTVRELAERVVHISGRNIAIEHIVERRGDIRESLGSNEKISQFLGGYEYVNVNDGLKRTFG